MPAVSYGELKTNNLGTKGEKYKFVQPDGNISLQEQ